jgi:DNA (cytosine-5)-methyltransferase 1
VPQLRRRVIIIGVRKDLNIIPEPIIPINPDNRIAVGSILQKREDVDPKQFLSERAITGLMAKRAITGLMAKRARMRREGKGFGAQFLDLTKPSYTIPARYWKDGYDALVKYSDTEIRRLTILELKRIQTFPDEYILRGSEKDAVACRLVMQ